MNPIALRELHELINNAESAFPMLRQWANAIPGRCVGLPPSPDAGQALVQTQVTTRSPMGAMIYHTGGILVDHGWLRILGSGGNPQLSRSLPVWNEGRGEGFLLIADDAAGGFFALNGNAFAGEPGSVFYWAPDALDWMDLGVGYSAFLEWALTTEMTGFFNDLRWPGWEREVAALSGDRCFAFYPFLWTAEGSPTTSHRSTVPVSEAFDFKSETARQLGGVL